MKRLFRLNWLVFFLVGTLMVQSQGLPPALPVTGIEIRHVGPPAVSDDLIRAHIRTKVGDTFAVQSTQLDLRNLESTGYFRNARVATEPADGGVKVVYLLTGKPVLTDVRFEGNKKYSDRKLRKKVTAKIGEPIDAYQLHSSALEIEKMYQKAGLQRTQVEVKEVVNESLGRGSVTFVVEESPKIRVTDVIFSNATAFKQSKLRKVIKTRRWWWLSWLTGSGKLKDEQFAEDKQKLIAFYQSNGYIDFEIRDILFEEPEPNRMVIRFDVYEGKQYRVGKVTFKGNEKFTQEEIRAGVRVMHVPVRPPMLEDDVFTPQGLDDDRRAIEDFYGARGYIGPGDMGRVPVQALREPNLQTGTMDLTFVIEEGQPSRIERIEITGNTRTKDRVIRRELAVSPGETFNMVRVQISKRRLEGLGFLSQVETDVDPTEDVPNARNLIVAVEEGQSGSFYLGAGFSTVESIFGYVGITQGNFDLFNPPSFTGAGQKLRLQLTLGTEQQNIEMRFVEPWFLGRRLMLEVDAFHRDLQYLSDIYDQRETGGRVGLIKELLPSLRGGVSYTLESIGIDFEDNSTTTNVLVLPMSGGGRALGILPPQVSPEMALMEGDWLVSKVGFSLAYDRRGPGFLPERGHKEELAISVGGGALGGDTDFYKWEFQSSWYFKGFGEGHVLELGGRIGVVEPYGNSSFTYIWDRFYLGGAYTLRGYRFRDIGPRDSLNQPIGGNSLWIASAEYSIPIVERVRLAAFYDAGAVNADAYDFSLQENFADDVGIGLRIVIPQMGPLRLDYAFPLRHPDYVGGNPRFQFSVGYERPL